MNKNISKVQFSGTNYQPIYVEKNQKISEYLTIENSPVLFGCRTGICGTCLVVVEGDIPPPSSEEKEILEILAPDKPKARLACQIQLTNDITIINE